MSGTPIIRTTRLSRTFGATKAVTELTLSVPAGITFGFLGPNGAGKTTTMRLLLGILEPSSGSAEVLGFDVARSAGEIRRRCGALIEEAGLYQRLTGLENLEFFGRLYGMSSSEIHDRAKELLGELGLWERRNERVGGWSRGMKQKLAVARALLHRPTLAFLDEPTAGLDVESAARLREELSGMVELGATSIFLATHSMGEAEQLCQRIGVFANGRLLAEGTPTELRAACAGEVEIHLHGSGFAPGFGRLLAAQPVVHAVEERSDRIVCRVAPDVEASDIVRLAVAQRQTFGEVNVVRPSLEDALRQIVKEADGA